MTSDRTRTADVGEPLHTAQQRLSHDFLDRAFEWRRVLAECWGTFLLVVVAGILAVLFLRAMLGTAGALGATVPGAGFGTGKALAMEVLLTAGLVNTVVGTATGARNIGTNGAIAVGGYIALAGLWAAPVSGASMNPVRSFAPDLVRVYIVGPLLGALLGVALEAMLVGKPTAAGSIAAQGALDVDHTEK